MRYSVSRVSNGARHICCRDDLYFVICHCVAVTPLPAGCVEMKSDMYYLLYLCNLTIWKVLFIYIYFIKLESFKRTHIFFYFRVNKLSAICLYTSICLLFLFIKKHILNVFVIFLICDYDYRFPTRNTIITFVMLLNLLIGSFARRLLYTNAPL